MNTCHWCEDENGAWDTSCGQTFVLNESGPADNGMKYCCYCGEYLVEVEYSLDKDDE